MIRYIKIYIIPLIILSGCMSSGDIDNLSFKKALKENEIKKLMEGATSMLAVNPNGKLAASWGAIKGSIR